MYKLRLNAKECTCCSICMDLCPMEAIGLRLYSGSKIEGDNLIYNFSGQNQTGETPPAVMMSYPFMSRADSCDGCLVCVNECPVAAIEILEAG